MDLHLELRYAAAPDAVRAVLVDEAFQAELAAATGALAHDVAVSPHGTGTRVRLHRTMPPVVPDFVRSFIGDSLDVTDTTDWATVQPDGTCSGELEVAIAKAPLSLRGTTRIDPDATGSRQTIAATLKASVPFVGRKIEESAAQAVELAARKQESLAAAWLARDPR